MRINDEGREKKERRGRKEQKKKGIEAQSAKPPTSTRAIDALIGDGEQKGRRKKEENERNRERGPNPTTLNLSVAS